MGQGSALPLLSVWRALHRPRIDYLKIDCEGCELPDGDGQGGAPQGSVSGGGTLLLGGLLPFLRELKRDEGEVPIAQLQIEIHGLAYRTRNMSALYAAHGMSAVLQTLTHVEASAYRRGNARGRALVAALGSFGFVPFHVEFNAKHGDALEYSFANVACSTCRWPGPASRGWRRRLRSRVTTRARSTRARGTGGTRRRAG